MFKHILIPTDGSAASTHAIHGCMAFAKKCGASVTGVYVIPEFHVFTYKTEMLEDTEEQFTVDGIVHAKKYLEEIETAAREAGVKYDTKYLTSDHPFEAIIRTAGEQECDLIIMASHGRKGVKGLLLGSETQKVLTHSQIPVLVYR